LHIEAIFSLKWPFFFILQNRTDLAGEYKSGSVGSRYQPGD
jgi:hypothetical protein